jgi:phosphatidylserine decarboxylase
VFFVINPQGCHSIGLYGNDPAHGREQALSRLRGRTERALVRAFSNPALSRVVGRLADLRLPGPVRRPLLRAYVRAYGVDMAEAAQPLAAYRTFNEFFTRRLREGARPIDPRPAAIVSPSDSRLQSLGKVPDDLRLEQIKGRAYTVAELLGDPSEAQPFTRGVHATLYLSPSMYHRVHVPVDGHLTAWRYLPGRLYPVNALAVRSVEGLFTVNERVVVMIDAGSLGPVAVVLVGATNVGRITLSFVDFASNTGGPATAVRLATPVPVRRGDELGAFNLGSTVVLLAAERSLEPANVRVGDVVNVGQALWARS